MTMTGYKPLPAVPHTCPDCGYDGLMDRTVEDEDDVHLFLYLYDCPVCQTPIGCCWVYEGAITHPTNAQHIEISKIQELIAHLRMTRFIIRKDADAMRHGTVKNYHDGKTMGITIGIRQLEALIEDCKVEDLK